MTFEKYVEQIANITLAKRIAAAYVADYRRLNLEEIKEFLLKTANQYTSAENIAKQLEELKLNPNRTIRIVTPIFLRDILMNEDDFLSRQKDTDSAILAYERMIIDKSNDFDINKITKEMALFKFILDTAWAHNNDISVDAKNLIKSVRVYLGISIQDQLVLEAKSGRFPTVGNIVHTSDDIEETRKFLQSKGLLVAIKNADGEICDMIPEDIAKGLRAYYGIEIRAYGYEKLIDYVAKKMKKQYLIDIVEKAHKRMGVPVGDELKNPTIPALKELISKTVKPTNLLGGYSANDGLNMEELQNWCADLGLYTSGVKKVLIERILEHYDSIRKIEIKTEDEREKYFGVFAELARRDLKFLRSNNIIDKDLQCEHCFEEATDYLFEVMLLNKPLQLTGTEHPDGKLTFKDRYIMWDNKSKETAVNLKEHIQQFDRYIKTSDKEVAVFIVIAPSFTEQSVQVCVDYALNNDTQILLITAEQLKTVAEMWNKKHPGEIFNLGYFKQNGLFDIKLLNI